LPTSGQMLPTTCVRAAGRRLKKSLCCRDKLGERGGTRTLDPMIKSHVLGGASSIVAVRVVILLAAAKRAQSSVKPSNYLTRGRRAVRQHPVPEYFDPGYGVSEFGVFSYVSESVHSRGT
jgi:hypothetical protein